MSFRVYMNVDEVNRLITNEVDDIEDGDTKQFIRKILKFERGNMGKDNYEYKKTYRNLIKDYTNTGDD